jgi:hypothetical protein
MLDAYTYLVIFCMVHLVGRIDVGRVRINFWDLGGQRELQTLWNKYYNDAHAVVFVIDATDMERIEDVKRTFGMPYVFITLDIEQYPASQLSNIFVPGVALALLICNRGRYRR